MECGFRSFSVSPVVLGFGGVFKKCLITILNFGFFVGSEFSEFELVNWNEPHGPEYAADEPEFMAEYGRTLAEWGGVEHELARVFSVLIQPKSTMSAAAAFLAVPGFRDKLTVGLVLAEVPAWFVILMAVFLTLSVLTYLGTYLYCLFNNPDALRSETYTIRKMAIERGLIGDDVSGIFEVGDGPSPKQIGQTAEKSKKEGDQ